MAVYNWYIAMQCMRYMYTTLSRNWRLQCTHMLWPRQALNLDCLSAMLWQNFCSMEFLHGRRFMCLEKGAFLKTPALCLIHNFSSVRPSQDQENSTVKIDSYNFLC